MIAININVLVSLLFPLRPEVSWESHLFGEDGEECPPCQIGVCITDESSNDGTLLISWAR
jgi:hypothetical protein